MTKFTLHNKLSGKGKFELSLEDFPIDRMPDSGITPMPVVLEEKIGTEMGLFLIDKTPFIYQLAKVRPFNLLRKSGVVRTNHGPLMFLVFYVPNPNGSAEPVVTLECYLNPHDRVMIQPWKDLSRQSYWHLILVNAEGEEVDLFEFKNTFCLGEALDLAAKACEGFPPEDFDLAIAEFCEKFSLADLFKVK